MAFSIPRSTANATLGWGQTFVSALEAAPATYQIPAPVIASLRVLVDLFQDAFDLAGVIANVAVDPANYTQPLRAALATARSDFLGLASQTAVQLQANDAISDMEKLVAGVVPRNFTRTPVPAPSSEPVLTLQMAISGVHQLTRADINTPSLRAMPTGVAAMQLFVHIHTAGAPALFTSASLQQTSPRSPLVVAHDPGDVGMVATYWGRWVSRRGLVGPVSAPLNVTILFGS